MNDSTEDDLINDSVCSDDLVIALSPFPEDEEDNCLDLDSICNKNLTDNVATTSTEDKSTSSGKSFEKNDADSPPQEPSSRESCTPVTSSPSVNQNMSGSLRNPESEIWISNRPDDDNGTDVSSDESPLASRHNSPSSQQVTAPATSDSSALPCTESTDTGIPNEAEKSLPETPQVSSGTDQQPSPTPLVVQPSSTTISSTVAGSKSSWNLAPAMSVNPTGSNISFTWTPLRNISPPDASNQVIDVSSNSNSPVQSGVGSSNTSMTTSPSGDSNECIVVAPTVIQPISDSSNSSTDCTISESPPEKVPNTTSEDPAQNSTNPNNSNSDPDKATTSISPAHVIQPVCSTSSQSELISLSSSAQEVSSSGSSSTISSSGPSALSLIKKSISSETQQQTTVMNTQNLVISNPPPAFVISPDVVPQNSIKVAPTVTISTSVSVAPTPVVLLSSGQAQTSFTSVALPGQVLNNQSLLIAPTNVNTVNQNQGVTTVLVTKKGQQMRFRLDGGLANSQWSSMPVVSYQPVASKIVVNKSQTTTVTPSILPKKGFQNNFSWFFAGNCILTNKLKMPRVPTHLHMRNLTVVPCTCCGSDFYSEDGFKEHMERTTMKLSYSCPKCTVQLSARNKCAFWDVFNKHACSASCGFRFGSLVMSPPDKEPMRDNYRLLHSRKSSEEQVSTNGAFDASETDLKITNVESCPVKVRENLSVSLSETISEGLDGQPWYIFRFIKQSMNRLIRTADGQYFLGPKLRLYLQLKSLLYLFCPECGKNCNSKLALSQHFVPKPEQGKPSNVYECRICLLALPSVCAFVAHRRMHEGKPPYVCPECGDSMFQTKELFKEHLNFVCMHASRCHSISVCPKCPKQFRNWDTLKHHLKEHFEKYTKCISCPMAFKSVDKFRDHNVLKHGGQGCWKVINKCPLCEKVDNSIGSDHLNSHMEHLMGSSQHGNGKLNDVALKNNGASRFKCSQCSCIFDMMSALVKHMRAKHKSVCRKEMCNFCGQDFVSEMQLASHMCERHKKAMIKHRDAAIEKLKDHLCSECGSTFDPLSVQSHKKICRGKPSDVEDMDTDLSLITDDADGTSIEKLATDTADDESESPFGKAADIPDKDVEDRADTSLSSVKVENGVQGALECAQCQKTFDDEAVYNKHMSRHEFILQMKSRKRNNKSESSDVVSKKAKKIKEPVKIPSPVPRFPCSECDLIFFEEDELVKHLEAEHDIGVSFSCHLCGETFTAEKALSSHVVTHRMFNSKTDGFTCCICRAKNVFRSFSHRGHLASHLKSHHKVLKSAVEELVNQSSNSLVKDEPADDDAKQPVVKRLKLADDKMYTCAKCKFVSEDKDLFHSHIVKHKQTPGSVQCEECGLCFLSLPSLKRHLVVVHKVKDVELYVSQSNAKSDNIPLPNVEFGNVVVSQGVFKQFISKQEEVQQNDEVVDPLECQVCHKVLETEALLNKHIRRHGVAFVKSRRKVITV